MSVEQASFFMLMPLPGSRDYARMMESGEYMDPDLNRYDAFHETLEHPNFTPGQLLNSYREAWKNYLFI